jgi:hypothetical protein
MNLRLPLCFFFGGTLVLACSSTPAVFSELPGDGTSSTSSGNTSSSGVVGFTTTSSGGTSGQADCVASSDLAEVPGNNCDDDGDGKVDNVETCDQGIAVGASAADFARALDICKQAKGANDWGLVSATYTRGFRSNEQPNPGQHGVLSSFGARLKPKKGERLGVLSTGFARAYNDEAGLSQSFLQGQTMDEEPATAPPGFPKKSPSCDGAGADRANVFDMAVAKLVLRAPKNAKGFAFDFNFHTAEWPAYICSQFNDSFVAYLTRKDGKADNISFDAKNNPVSVNLGFLDRCTKNVEIGCAGRRGRSVCTGGPDELLGTGFGITGRGILNGYCSDTSTGGGATGWLTTTSPINPGEEFTLEFYLWDTGDNDLDSSVLLDNFRWEYGEVKTETVRPN